MHFGGCRWATGQLYGVSTLIMRRFVTVLIMVFGGSCLTMAGQLDTNTMQGVVLRVKIERVQVIASGSRLRWGLSLHNPGLSTIRVSLFSLQSLLTAGRLRTADGMSWQVVPPKELRDPPPPDTDYTLRLTGNGGARTEIESDGLELVTSEHRNLTPALPSQVNYDFDREVAVIEDATRKPFWVRCIGSGSIGIEKDNSQSGR